MDNKNFESRNRMLDLQERILDLQEKMLENQSKLFDYAIKDHGPMSVFTGIGDFFKKVWSKTRSSF